MGVPLINGRSHSWADVSVNIGGVPVIGITAINYDETQVKEDNFGAGVYPVARGYGNKKATADMTLYSNEVEALMDRAPNGSGNLLDYGAFEIIVQYMVGTTIITHILKNVEFTKNERKVKQGDTNIQVDLPLITSHIIWRK